MMPPPWLLMVFPTKTPVPPVDDPVTITLPTTVTGAANALIALYVSQVSHLLRGACHIGQGIKLTAEDGASAEFAALA